MVIDLIAIGQDAGDPANRRVYRGRNSRQGGAGGNTAVLIDSAFAEGG